MPATLGVNLRVTCHGSRGDRKYMEDFFVLSYEPSEDKHKQEYAFFGIFDGHGGKEAALFAKEHLMKFIVSDKRFWSDDDDDVLQSITNGFLQTHYAMWQDQVNWPKTSSGLPSTSGTTASIAFIRRGKIYIGHVGDSSIVLGFQKEGQGEWVGKALTKDHKPEDAYEVARIEACGGKVVSKSGVPRVVWNRPRLGHKGPVRRSTPIDEIPFLAVARSLGDLWSYNSDKDEFVVSPYPDVHVIDIDVESHRCLIFGTDGLWNMLNPQDGVNIVQSAEQHNEKNVYYSGQPATAKNQMWVNPSKSLVDRALRRWSTFGARADNTSAVTLMLDPPGAQRRSGDRIDASLSNMQTAASNTCHANSGSEMNPPVPKGPGSLTIPRIAIFTRTAPMESAQSANLPQASDSTGPQSPKVAEKCDADPLGATASSEESEPCDQLGSSQLLDCCPKPEPCEVGEAECVSPIETSPAELMKERCTLSEDSSTRNCDNKPELEDSHSQTKTPAPQEDVGDSLEDRTNEHLFQKTSSVDADTSQEYPRLQEPPQPATESVQRHSHKRMRGKTVIGGESSASLSLMRTNTSGDIGIVRRRHSSVLDSRTGSLTTGFVSQSLGYTSSYTSNYQLGNKRRTRSEDKLLQAVGRLEDDLRTSDEENVRVGWTVNWINRLRPSDEGSEENNAHTCSTRRKKKWIRHSGNAIGRVKQARPSVSVRSNSSYSSACDIALTRDCNSEHLSSRVLRSDTHSGMPAHTLRSQNVDMKASRLAIHTPTKFTPKRSVQLKASLEMPPFAAGSSSLLPAAKLLLSTTGLAKRHRQSFCGRTRSITTRSRVKRLSK